MDPPPWEEVDDGVDQNHLVLGQSYKTRVKVCLFIHELKLSKT